MCVVNIICSVTEVMLLVLALALVVADLTYFVRYTQLCLHNAPVMACSNTFLEGSSAHGGTAVLFTIGGFPVLKLRKEVNRSMGQNSSSRLKSMINQ